MNDMSHFEHFDSLPSNVETPGVVFTYSHKGQSRLRRGLIRGIEMASGSRRFEKLYNEWRAEPHHGESVFSSSIAKLGVREDLVSGDLDNIPTTGGVLVVANHPYGIIDGLLLGHLISQRRQDVKLMVHSLLAQPAEARDILLPVDFGGTAEARRTTAETRRAAQDWLDAGHVLIIFPAGGISTAPTPLAKDAADPAWHPFIARLAQRPGVKTLPIFLHGQNSRLFQMVSHFSYPLRIALIFNETRSKMGRAVKVAVGDALDCSAWDRNTIVPRLREICFGLGGADASREYKYPKKFRF
jgi:putative hemolysin